MPLRHSGANWGRRHGRTRVFLTALLAIVLFVPSFAFAVSQQLYSRIKTIDVGVTHVESGPTASAEPIPADLAPGQPLNIVVIGTDDRSGDNQLIGGAAEGVRGDTTILIHITADRSQVRMASIPRDLMTQLPGCLPGENPEGTVAFSMFNNAFARGYDYQQDIGHAVTCVMQTISRSTGIMPDAAAVLDFKAVVDIVNELDGVQICGDNHFEPRDAGGLVLEPGCHRIWGDQAIQFLRARNVGSDGSDLKRIERQQCFLRSASVEVLEGGLLEQISNIFSVAKVLTAHTTLTENLASVPNLAGLMYSLRNLTPADVVTRTAPVAQYPQDPNRVIWGYGADQFWQDFVAPPAPEPTPAPSASSEPSESTEPTQQVEPTQQLEPTPEEIPADDREALRCY